MSRQSPLSGLRQSFAVLGMQAFLAALDREALIVKIAHELADCDGHDLEALPVDRHHPYLERAGAVVTFLFEEAQSPKPLPPSRGLRVPSARHDHIHPDDIPKLSGSIFHKETD